MTPAPDFSAINSRWVIWKAKTGETETYQFIIWIRRKWGEFNAAHPTKDFWISPERHAQFDAWLDAQAPAVLDCGKIAP